MNLYRKPLDKTPTARPKRRWGIGLLLIIIMVFLTGFIIPEKPTMPVDGATSKDWNSQSFWYYPWGRSRVHKGIDIFAQEGTTVRAATHGLVLYTGYDALGGNFALVLGSKWRWHYYAHLQTVEVKSGRWVKAGEKFGTVGATGNAKGKSPHLHYTIKSMYPRFWTLDKTKVYPWQRVLFIDPSAYLQGKAY